MTDFTPATQSIIALMARHIDEGQQAEDISLRNKFDSYADEELGRNLRVKHEADLSTCAKTAEADDIYAAFCFWGQTTTLHYLEKNACFRKMQGHQTLILAALHMAHPNLNTDDLQEKMGSLSSMELQNLHMLIKPDAGYKDAVKAALKSLPVTPDTLARSVDVNDARLLKVLSMERYSIHDDTQETAFAFFNAALDEYEEHQGHLTAAQTIRLAAYLALASRQITHDPDLFRSRLYGQNQITDLHKLFQGQIDFWTKQGPKFHDIRDPLVAMQSRIDAYRDQTELFRDPVPHAEALAHGDQEAEFNQKLALAEGFTLPEGYISFYDTEVGARYKRHLTAAHSVYPAPDPAP